MVDRNQMLYLNSTITKAEPSNPDDDSLVVSGYASTVDVDRHGDVVSSAAWQRGLNNYLKNPIILAFHNHSMPIGRMVEHRIDDRGLWIKARISKAASAVYELVKDGILSAFSIGFRVVDAEYNQLTELFVVKELELHEISVVSVPANQETLFSLAKAFDTQSEYKQFKLQFAPESESAKGLESSVEANSISISKEWNMTPEEMKQAMVDAARQAAEEAAKAVVAEQQKAAQALAAQQQAERDLEAKIKAAVSATVETGVTGAEKLLAEVEKRFADQAEQSKSAIAGLEAALKEKAAELEAIQKSKMQFNDKGVDGISYAEKEKAVLLAQMANKDINATKFARELVQKYGGSGTQPHLPTATWHTEVSMNMENEVRRRLVVAPTMRAINMQTNVMKIPLNPEATTASWVQNTQFGQAASAGNNATHALKEVTLSAFKVATNEYVAFEEEEDALMAILPVIRDGMIRRVARAVDRAFLRGTGVAGDGDPVAGLTSYDAASAVTLDISDNAKLTVEKLRALRRDLGLWGLDPADLIYIVSTDGYFDLLDDANFLTVDKVGAQATILTGQIGTVGNSPVLVSGEFADKGVDAVGAIAYAPGNFLVGNQRGLRVDTQDLVETQRRVLVASLRTGMTQVTSAQGAGVSALRYIA